jgi:predicted RNase H-like HicB family nuclease
VKGEDTSVIEEAEEGGYRAYCPEIPGANGQGETVEEVKEDLAAAVSLILKDRLEDSLRGLPDDAMRDTFAIA